MPSSTPGSVMATLELSIDEDVAVSPVKRTRRLGPLFWAAIAWIILIFAAAGLVGVLPLPSPTDMDMLERRAPASVLHWLGTEGLGRDELARLIYGARISLIVGLCAPMIGITIGGALGMLAGYFRGRFETLVVGSMDVLLAFPPLILALAVTAYLGQSILNLTCILGVLGIPAFMRVARAATLVLARREFVIAAQCVPAVVRLLPAWRCRHHRRRERIVFLRLGGTASDIELGQHDRRGTREPGDRAAARLPSRHRDVPDRTVLQPGRRRAAGAHRSASGRAVTEPALLSVEGVSVDLPTPRGNLRAVDQVDVRIGAGRTLGIVGESGCGKTMLSRAILQLLPKKAKLSGRVRFDGQDLVRLDPERLRKLRGRSLAVVFQDPMTSLNPVLTIGTQLIETLQEHLELDSHAAKHRSIELLAAVGIPAPEQRLMQYPHQLSGGMRQRVAIAIALSCEPKLLIADEPTTALDVTIQAQILDLLAREQRRRHMAMILITHDLGVVAGRTDEVAVMYAGRVVERAPTPVLFKKMHMPYTEALLAAIPKIDAAPHTPLPAISGRPPDPTRPIQGCSFSPRCRYAAGRCYREKPLLASSESLDHQYACFHPIQVTAGVCV